MSDSNEVEVMFVNFLREMSVWELSFHNYLGEIIAAGKLKPGYEAEYKKKLSDIFEKYVDADAKTKARMDLLGAGLPVMYDPDRDKIHSLEIADKKATILLDQAEGFQSRFKFTLGLVSGEWRIKRKDTYDGGKWKKSTI